MPVIQSQSQNFLSALEVLYARCGNCMNFIEWRHLSGKVWLKRATCCGMIFDAAPTDNQRNPIFHVTWGHADMTNVKRLEPRRD